MNKKDFQEFMDESVSALANGKRARIKLHRKDPRFNTVAGFFRTDHKKSRQLHLDLLVRFFGLKATKHQYKEWVNKGDTSLKYGSSIGAGVVDRLTKGALALGS